MNEEPCIICGRDALCINVPGQADTCDYRCDNCGNYLFRNDQNKDDYEDLDGEQRERIANYVREFNKARGGKWADFGDIETLWKKIEEFNKERKEE